MINSITVIECPSMSIGSNKFHSKITITRSVCDIKFPINFKLDSSWIQFFPDDHLHEIVTSRFRGKLMFLTRATSAL